MCSHIRCRRVGDRTSKSERFIEHLTPLQELLERYARRSLRDAADLEDALQDAIGRAFRDFDLYVEGTNFRAWIFRYVTYEILNRNRRADRHRTEALPADLPRGELGPEINDESVFEAMLIDPDLILEEFDDSLVAALRRLTALERTTLFLRAIGEFSYREISDILDIPLGSVMGYLSRARLRMRCGLAEFPQETRRHNSRRREGSS